MLRLNAQCSSSKTKEAIIARQEKKLEWDKTRKEKDKYRDSLSRYNSMEYLGRLQGENFQQNKRGGAQTLPAL